MREYPSPCDSCTQTCTGKSCDRWRIRYLYRQKQINAYARKYGIKPTTQEPEDACQEPDREAAVL